MEFVIISGKGGTGKTTIAGSFMYLASKEDVKVDCDIDTSNLHLLFDYKIASSEKINGKNVAFIDQEKCIGCFLCKSYCQFDAIDNKDGIYNVLPWKCTGCGVCGLVCKTDAIMYKEKVVGNIIKYETNKGMISSAELKFGAKGSSKIITMIRNQAFEGNKNKAGNTIVDGSPGLGCSVISSLVDSDYGIIVTEPTLSGFSDFERIKELIDKLGIEPLVIINKYDLNEEITNNIKLFCDLNNVRIVGMIPFDKEVEEAINMRIPVVSNKKSKAGIAISEIWEIIKNIN